MEIREDQLVWTGEGGPHIVTRLRIDELWEALERLMPSIKNFSRGVYPLPRALQDAAAELFIRGVAGDYCTAANVRANLKYLRKEGRTDPWIYDVAD